MQSPRVGTLLVVVAQIGGKITLQAGQLGHQTARKGRPPALLEDGALDALDGTVSLRSAGMDEGVLGAELGQRGVELGRTELRAVVREDALEALASRSEVAATRRASELVAR